MNNLGKIDKNTIKELIVKYKVKAADAGYVMPADNLTMRAVIFMIFIYSLLHLFLFSSKIYGQVSENIIFSILICCMLYFIYDSINFKIQAKRRFKRELWLLKTLLENEEVRQFYKEGGASPSQRFFNQENIKNWEWSFDFTSPMRRVITEFFIKKFHIMSGKIIILGCAEGYFFDTLKSYGNITYGLDLNMSSLQKVDRDNNAYLCLADAERIPFRSSSFDAALFLEVLEHLSSPQAAVIETDRILKPGAILFLSTPNANCIPMRYILNPLIFLAQFLTIWLEALRLPKALINIWRGQYFFHTAFSRKEIKHLLGDRFKIKYWTTYGIGGGAIGLLLKLKPSLRKILNQLNNMESRRQYTDNYNQERKALAGIEERYGSRLGRINIFLQRLPLIKLIGSNHFIILEKNKIS